MAVCLLLAGGCGGDSKGDGPIGQDPSAPTAEEFPARYAAAFCATTSRCCVFSGGSQTEDCETSEQAEQLSDASEAEQADATFDAQAAADCLSALEGASCEVDPVSLLRTVLPRCDVWRGTVPPGGACESAIACDDPGADVSVGCIGGVCRAVQRLPRGSACTATSTSAVCDPLLDYCDEDEQRCLELSDSDAPLLAPSACSQGNECASDVCADGRCASLLAGDYCAFPE